MKLTTLLTFSLLLIFQEIDAQSMTPPVSSSCEISQSIGFTDFSLQYSRPNVKGRPIFGTLIPNDVVWRAGANESTKLRASTQFSIGDQMIPAGYYALYVIPGNQDWTFTINRDTTLWGARGYNAEMDVFTGQFKPEILTRSVETMSWFFENVYYDRADLVMQWADRKLTIPISTPTDQITKDRIQDKLRNQPTASEYYQASRYYLETGQDLEQAYQWMLKRVELGGDQFGILRYKALLEKKLGMHDQATKTMTLSRDLAREKGNDHYVRMNEKDLKSWNKQLTKHSAQDVIAQSIKYHDPQGRWNKRPLELTLFETRPGGSDRITEINVDLSKEYFEMTQRRGKDLLVRVIDGQKCEAMLNGRKEVTDKELELHRLNCERTILLRDYYNYLWLLPMKLLDPGTLIDPNVHMAFFDDRNLLEVKVTYDAQVGHDIWYFYFHPDTYALSGYRFYHDESKNDGEYILLEDEIEIDGMTFPAKRHWYTHFDNRYLGTDELIQTVK